MFGAFIGDIVGSIYEFYGIKTKKFPLFDEDCDYTDDSIMTVAVACATMKSYMENCNGDAKNFNEFVVSEMQYWGNRYSRPTGGYGRMFKRWLKEKDPKPYGSFGNGSAMRVSPCGLAAVTLEEAEKLAEGSASVSHNHFEGIIGAKAIAGTVFLAKTGASKEQIREYVSKYYNLDFTLDEIRDTYSFESSCQKSVPQAVEAFLESTDFEDAIRNAISIGGDSDTIGAICGSIAWTYYRINNRNGYSGWVNDVLSEDLLEIKNKALAYLPDEFIEIEKDFHKMCCDRMETYKKTGTCTAITKN